MPSARPRPTSAQLRVGEQAAANSNTMAAADHRGQVATSAALLQAKLLEAASACFLKRSCCMGGLMCNSCTDQYGRADQTFSWFHAWFHTCLECLPGWFIVLINSHQGQE